VIEKTHLNQAPFIDRNFARPGQNQEQEETLSFADTLGEVLADVNNLQIEADKAAEEILTGNIENIHQVMIKTEEARLSLQLTGQVVNKVLDAYQEISRMQI